MLSGSRFAKAVVCGLVFAALCLAASPIFCRETQQEQQAQQDAEKPKAAGSDAAPQADTITPQLPPQNEEGNKGSRVFGVMPNQLTVEGATVVKPISAGEKFKLTAEGAFDPYEFVIVGILAGIGQATNDTPQWGQGAKGYGIRYGTDLGDLLIGNFMVGAVFPSVLRQDPRYFQSGKGGFWHRASYALSRVVITYGDNGKTQFNASEIAGNAMAGVISNTYHPPSQRTFAETTQTWATQLGIDAVGFELKEFWPDIRHWFSKKKKIPVTASDK